LAHVVMPRWCN